MSQEPGNGNRSNDVVVVGGGLAGLTAAATLARKGCSVVLLEQHHEAGGRARSERRDDFVRNLGPHALYRGGEGIGVLEDLGVRFAGNPPRPAGFAIRDGRKHTLPGGPVSLLTTGLLRLPEKIEAARLLATLPDLDTRDLASTPLREWLDRSIRHQGVRALVEALVRVATYANAPDLMSTRAALDQVKLALTKNVLYLDRGWQTLVDGLAEVARAAGADVRTGVSVRRVEVAGSRGVRLADGSFVPAGDVVLAVSPERASALLDGAAGRLVDDLVRDLVPVRAACLDLWLSRTPKPRATFALGIDVPLYFSLHSAWARLAPEAGGVVHVAKYLPPEDERDPRDTRAELERLMDLLQPGWREHLVDPRFFPNLTVVHALPRADRGGLAGRPPLAVTGTNGLWLAGDWVGATGHLADAALASGRDVAHAILARRAATQPSEDPSAEKRSAA